MNTLGNMFTKGVGAAVISGWYGLGHRAITFVVDIPSSIAPIPPTWAETIPWGFSTGALLIIIDKIYARVQRDPDTGEKIAHLGVACIISSFAVEAVFKQTPSRELARGFGPLLSILGVIAAIDKLFSEIQKRCQNG